MGLCINIATTYNVKTSPVFLNVLNERKDLLYIDKILNFLQVLGSCKSYWQDREEDVIPRVVEVDKSDILDYLNENSDSIYKETLKYILQISDKNNDFIHLEIS